MDEAINPTTTNEHNQEISINTTGVNPLVDTNKTTTNDIRTNMTSVTTMIKTTEYAENGSTTPPIVAVSQHQQQEVYNILAMLKPVPEAGAPTSSSNQQNEKYNENADEFEGEYNSCDEEGQVLPDEDDVHVPTDSRTFANTTTDLGTSAHKRSRADLTNSKLSNNTNIQVVNNNVSRNYYGKAKQVQSTGKFPELGAVLGPFFCLGQLGKGTFSSIHKCISMNYFHNKSSSSTPALNSQSYERVAAAKVELVSFQQSGVLEAEATILDYLHHSLPPNTVPVYMGHYKSDEFAAIFMEYLPGEDMHQIRERVMATTAEAYSDYLESDSTASSNVSLPTRRINVNDAVYLTADVMLPLLQRIHEIGVVHRDVKPSNCVRAATGPKAKQFCMVDFGLSKSIIVPEDSEYADKNHYWGSDTWLKPYVYQNVENAPKGCYREERKKADFRGTSMYASLRVHQNRDYCPRDDVWSLLYVFCDLVTGGLPWMQHAANRDRDECQRFKERIHGEMDGGNGVKTQMAELLKGDIYHKALYQREKSIEAGVPEEKLPPLPLPLAMCEENTKINCLSKAFYHVSKLQFWEKPNYDLVQDCIRGFLRGSNSKDPIIRPINWDALDDRSALSSRKREKKTWQYTEVYDPLDDYDQDIFQDVEDLMESQRNTEDFMTRIPVQLRFKLAQMDYNLSILELWRGNVDRCSVPMHCALNDWMNVTLDLLYKEWDSKRYEAGGHRTTTDGFKRDCYLQLLEKCNSYAKKFHLFGQRNAMYDLTPNASDSAGNGSSQNGNDTNGAPKRRKVQIHSIYDYSSNPSVDLALISKCIFGLHVALRIEQSKKTAPPVRISFS